MLGAGDLVATAGRSEVGRTIAWRTSGRRASEGRTSGERTFGGMISGGRTSRETTAGMTRAERSRGGSWVAPVIFWNSCGVRVCKGENHSVLCLPRQGFRVRGLGFVVVLLAGRDEWAIMASWRQYETGSS